MTDGTPARDTPVQMNAGTLERSGLDRGTLMRVRIAALTGAGAPPASYLLSQAASELGASPERVQGVPLALAPMAGRAAIAAAASSITAALGMVIEFGELAEEARGGGAGWVVRGTLRSGGRRRLGLESSQRL